MSRWTILAVLPLLALPGCGDRQSGPEAPGTSTGLVISDDVVSHIHGLGVNPADDALIVATHSGLFRAAPGQRRAVRLSELRQDTMGFTVVGADRFLGSGHPAVGAGQPPVLGLIESDDAGRSWTSLSLSGKADFHVLRASRRRIYGVNSTDGVLLISGDGGRRWERSDPPGTVVDLAIDPKDPDRVVVSGDQGLARSENAGRTWKRLGGDLVGLLAWGSRLVLVDANGRVHASTDGGRGFTAVGDVGSQPAATSTADEQLLVALRDNSVRSSDDGGRTWQVRLNGQ
ncbi:MAG: F510_1955 family glycosylhydrolase [Solirubrobacteraceae bacterium]